MPRGRPEGTKKRIVAEAAAQSIVDGWHNDIHAAALAYFHRHAGGAPRKRIGPNEAVRFRHFVRYVEEAHRELIQDSNNCRGSLSRTYGPLARRSQRRERQIGRSTVHRNRLKAEAKRMSFKVYFRDLLDN